MAAAAAVEGDDAALAEFCDLVAACSVDALVSAREEGVEGVEEPAAPAVGDVRVEERLRAFEAELRDARASVRDAMRYHADALSVLGSSGSRGSSGGVSGDNASTSPQGGEVLMQRARDMQELYRQIDALEEAVLPRVAQALKELEEITRQLEVRHSQLHKTKTGGFAGAAAGMFFGNRGPQSGGGGSTAPATGASGSSMASTLWSSVAPLTRAVGLEGMVMPSFVSMTSSNPVATGATTAASTAENRDMRATIMSTVNIPDSDALIAQFARARPNRI